jgi:hypothetical protein
VLLEHNAKCLTSDAAEAVNRKIHTKKGMK